MPKRRNLIGQKFNRYTVLSRDEERSKEKKSSYYICQCDCGNIRSVLGSALTTGHTKSCGCLRNERVREIRGCKLEGQRFGMLTVLYQVDSIIESSGMLRTAWMCKCDCGREVIVKTINLRAGDTQSCGGYHPEKLSNKNNLTGQKIGKLTILELDLDKMSKRKDYDTRAYWKCQCDCGNICTIASDRLIKNRTLSCGCLHMSEGASLVMLTLQEESNWEIVQEFSYDDLRGNFLPLRFDFAVFQNSKLLFLIEYQGEYHYFPISGQDSYLKQKKYDLRKEKYCFQHRIPLITIPYYDKEKINLNYIKERYYATI